MRANVNKYSEFSMFSVRAGHWDFFLKILSGTEIACTAYGSVVKSLCGDFQSEHVSTSQASTVVIRHGSLGFLPLGVCFGFPLNAAIGFRV